MNLHLRHRIISDHRSIQIYKIDCRSVAPEDMVVLSVRHNEDPAFFKQFWFRGDIVTNESRTLHFQWINKQVLWQSQRVEDHIHEVILQAEKAIKL